MIGARKLCSAILCSVCAVALAANAQKLPHINVATVPARATDVGSPEAIVRADLECISGGVGVPRQWGRDVSLYDPHGFFVATRTDPKTGKVTVRSETVQEYIDRDDASLVRDGITERELGHHVYRYGNVATVFSSYEAKTAAGKVAGRGVNVYQVYFDGKRWWIASVEWDEETPSNPIPAELLPK
jgi:hypothetical protein